MTTQKKIARFFIFALGIGLTILSAHTVTLRNTTTMNLSNAKGLPFSDGIVVGEYSVHCRAGRDR